MFNIRARNTGLAGRRCMVEVSPFEVFAASFPEVTDAYREMKRSYGAAGPLDEKTKQLIRSQDTSIKEDSGLMLNL